MLHGRILDATQLQPVSGASVRVSGPADLLRGVPGAVALPAAGAPAWRRLLTNFAGTRWQCWVAHVRDHVPGISWEEFRDQVLLYNPQLAADGRLFQREQSYILPEAGSAAPARWSRLLTNFAGTRWQCWEAYIRDRVPGISWAEFRDQSLQYNPQLASAGRLFRNDQTYVIPQTDLRPWMELGTSSTSDGSFQLPISHGGPLDLRVGADGYLPQLRQLDLSDAAESLACLFQLQPAQSRRSGSIRSTLTGYSALSAQLRALIDAGLYLLGDDRQTYDALPPAWQVHCYGHRFAAQPEHPNCKDIVCADVVTIALTAAGCSLPHANLFLADSYHPARLGALGHELAPGTPPQPGDILVFGDGDPNSQARHVALYVGPFWGTDRSGISYALAAGYDVVEGSLVSSLNGKPIGRGVIGTTLAQCRQKRRGYAWMRAVRMQALAGALASAA